MNKKINNREYKLFFTQVKEQIKSSQVKAALSINTSLIRLYWQLGQLIVEKQKENSWGNKVIDQLSQDLRSEFPDLQGFSRRNLYEIRRFFLFYNSEIVQQPVAQFSSPKINLNENDVTLIPPSDNKITAIVIVQQLVAQIPWGHNLLILNKVKDRKPPSFISGKPSNTTGAELS